MSFWSKLRYLVPSQRRAIDRDMQEELDSLQQLAGPGELGNLTLAAENARGELGWRWIEHIGQDLRYGLRSLTREKAFTVLAVSSLALGIGANTAIYSFIESILLRPLPVADPQSLVVMKWRAKTYTLASTGMYWSTDGSSYDAATGTISSIFPYPALKVFQDAGEVLSGAFCYFATSNLSVTVGDRTDSLLGQQVSGTYFQGMGVAPAAGRLIHAGDDVFGAPPVAVVSHRFALRRFADAQAAVGQTIRLNDKPLTVVGVAPETFFGAEPGAIPDVYIPLHAGTHTAGTFADEHFYWVEVMGRLKPGVSLAGAQARLEPAFHQFAANSATTEKQKQDLPRLTLQEGATGLDSLRRRYAQPLYVLMAMAAMILLIACANIANLLLARGAARRREVAIRVSVGASRWRVTRQLLTESVLLSSIAGALGAAIAWWGARTLTLLLANGRANFTLHAELNWHVLAVTMALSVVTGLLFGLAPALHATRVDVAPALKAARSADSSRSPRFRVGPALVVSQMVLSLLLLVSAGLFGRSLSSLHAIELGFNRENVLLFTIRPSSVGYKDQALNRLFEDVRGRLRRLPGVRQVTLTIRPLPMGGGTIAPVAIAGAPVSKPPGAVLASVGSEFFETMQIPLLAGREFTERDQAGARRVAVINRHLAELLGVPAPVGRELTLHNERFEIIGIAENALSFTLKEERRPALYLPYLQAARPSGGMTYAIRTAGPPLELAGAVRELVRQVDSRIAIHDFTTQAAHIDQAISTEIALARLCSLFGALALIISCVGLYGAVAFNVARRTNELGIRTALGASAGRIRWMILRDVCVMLGAGLAIGVPLVLAGSRYVKAFLFGIAPNDPAAIAAAAAALLAAGLLAGFIPARRASRIDPLIAIRCE